MRPRRSLFLLVAVAMATAGVVTSASPAFAVSNACSVGMYPNIPASQSNLKVACTFSGVRTTVAIGSNGIHTNTFTGTQTLNVAAVSSTGIAGTGTITVVQGGTTDTITYGGITLSGTNIIAFTNVTLSSGADITLATGNAVIIGSGGVSSSTTVSDYADAGWHFGAGRIVNASPVNGSKTIGTFTNPAGNVGAGAITAADLGHSIEGGCLPHGDFITKVPGTGGAGFVDVAFAALAGCGPAALLVANTQARLVKDGVTNTAATACGGQPVSATLICSATANFIGSDVGKTISGGTIGDGATILNVDLVAGMWAHITQAATTQANGVYLTIASGNAVTSARVLTDAMWGAANPTKICSPTAGFAASDIGLPVIPGPGQTGFPVGAHIITAVGGVSAPCLTGTSATITNPPTAVLTAAKQTIVGLSTKTAPANNDVVAHLSAELQLSPALTVGSPPCTAGKKQGFVLAAKWENPGSYNSTLPVGAQQFSMSGAPGTSIAQLNFQVTTVAFSGFVVQGSPYKVVFGFLPVALGVCSGSDVGTTYGFSATTQSQSLLPTGTGPAGTAQVRVIKDEVAGNHPYTAAVTTGATSFEPIVTSGCTVVDPATLNFSCGQG